MKQKQQSIKQKQTITTLELELENNIFDNEEESAMEDHDEYIPNDEIDDPTNKTVINKKWIYGDNLRKRRKLNYSQLTKNDEKSTHFLK